jgi:hypothetical protein
MSGDGAITSEQFDAEMSRLIGNIRPDAPKSRYTEYVAEIRRRYGHKSYEVIRKAVTLVITQSPADLPYAGNEFWGMFVREAERQLAEEARLNEGLLPLDEVRAERERRESYEQIRGRTGPGTQPFEWALCQGIALQRKRNRAADAYRGEWKLPTSRGIPDEVMKVPITDEEIEAVYQERRKAGVPVGMAGGMINASTVRDGGGFSGLQNLTHQRGWSKDIGTFRRERGWKPASEILAERKAAGTLSPQMEEYLLERIREEEGEAP